MEKVKTMFENRYMTGMEVLEEFVEKVVVLKYRDWKVFVGLLALLAVIVVFASHQSIFNILLAWGLCCFILLAVYPVRETKKIIKKSEINFKYEQNETVAWFDEDYITVSNGVDRSSIMYSEVKKLVETPNLYCLMKDGSNGVILRKDSFTLGTFASFRTYIETITHKKTIVRK
ncbi:MAG: YcxB family protein [Firmicutes bacterium]|nr:YcxB family protein [Bacillota bacterium]MBR6585287.1 YcxB family protein [Bacillota bacterium]